MICVQCSTDEDTIEFDSVKDFLEHEKGGHRSRPAKVLPPAEPVTPSATEKKEEKPKPVEEKRNPQPLRLIYHWVGECPMCLTEAKTIEVELDKTNMEIAYCLHCDKKLTQKEVPPIFTAIEQHPVVDASEKKPRGRPKSTS